MSGTERSGPLAGLRVVELAGIAPGPFAAMMLADMGADVVCVDRPGATGPGSSPQARTEVLRRGRRSIVMDLKHPEGRALFLRCVERSDALIEGFRPGVAERLGIGPDDCLAVNPRLVYGRVTGWGQDGPLAASAGRDINYIALAGALHQLGRSGSPPVFPLSLLGDFAGGGMLLGFGLLCGLLEAQRSGRGQVVDAAMVDGAALLMAMMWGYRASGEYNGCRGTNLFDGGSHCYEVYETADGGYVSVGAIAPDSYAELCRLVGVDGDAGAHLDPSRWPEGKGRLASVFRTRTRAEWSSLLEGTDACFASVLPMDEAPRHPHNLHRQTFVEYAGVTQPAPAPRFSQTPGAIAGPPPYPGEHTPEVLADWLGLDAETVERLQCCGAVEGS